MKLDFNDVTAVISIIIGIGVFILELRLSNSKRLPRWVYYYKGFAGLSASVAFIFALLRISGSDSIPSWIGRPAFIYCLSSLALGAILSHKDSVA